MTSTLARNWTRLCFDQVAEIVTGSTPSTSRRDFYGGPVPFVTPADLDQGVPIERAKSSLSLLGAQQARLVPKGSVLVCCIGATIGKVGIAGTDVSTNQQINSLVFDPSKVCSRYGYYYCQTLKKFIRQNGTSTTLPILNKGRFSKIEIPLPPLSEQNRIADILDKADAIRRKRQEELNALSALRSSVFLRLFADPRSGRSDWPEVSLGEVTVLDAPMVDPREEEYIDLVHLGPDRIEKNTGRLLTALTAREEGLISGKFLFDERYLLYSKIRPYLRKVALPHFKGLCSADVYPIRPVENITTREYLFALLISEAFLSYTTSLPSRASIPKLNRKELAAYKFRLPPIELQQEYTDILRSHEHITETFGRAADDSKHLFDSLAQRAFKGML